MDKGKDVNEWIKRAKASLARAKMPVTGDMLYEDACFDCQQSTEKALKGLIIHLKQTPPRTHILNILIKIIMSEIDTPGHIKDCVILNNYAVTTRYPDDYYEITEEEYHKAIEIAEDVYNWVVKTIK